MIHAVEIAHPGIPITLRNAFSDEEYQSISDTSGSFFVRSPPDGDLYPDHWRRRKVSRRTNSRADYTRDDIISSAKRQFLALELRDGGAAAPITKSSRSNDL